MCAVLGGGGGGGGGVLPSGPAKRLPGCRFPKIQTSSTHANSLEELLLAILILRKAQLEGHGGPSGQKCFSLTSLFWKPGWTFDPKDIELMFVCFFFFSRTWSPYAWGLFLRKTSQCSGYILEKDGTAFTDTRHV